MDNQELLREIRANVYQDFKRYRSWIRWLLFGTNLGLFIVISILLTIGMISTSVYAAEKNGVPAMHFLLILWAGWALAVIIHGVSAFMESDLGGRRLRAELEKRGVARKLKALGDKPKRKSVPRALRLTDDGELVPENDESKQVKGDTSHE